MIRSLVDLVFPPSCAACRRLGAEPFCDPCREALLPAGTFVVPGLDWAGALLLYGGPAALALHRFKYEGKEELARVLAPLLARAAVAAPPFELVVPIPLHRSRLRARGFNQAETLAHGLDRPISRSLLRRVRVTAAQVGLAPRARWDNLRGAFVADPRLEGRRVLLVDDVITTGATMAAAAAAVRAVGGTRVFGLALLHAPSIHEGT